MDRLGCYDTLGDSVHPRKDLPDLPAFPEFSAHMKIAAVL